MIRGARRALALGIFVLVAQGPAAAADITTSAQQLGNEAEKARVALELWRAAGPVKLIVELDEPCPDGGVSLQSIPAANVADAMGEAHTINVAAVCTNNKAEVELAPKDLDVLKASENTQDLGLSLANPKMEITSEARRVVCSKDEAEHRGHPKGWRIGSDRKFHRGFGFASRVPPGGAGVGRGVTGAMRPGGTG